MRVLEELNQFAHDLLWTWRPRIENLFRALDAELWKSTRENPVLLLTQLGEEGVEKAMQRDEVRQALEDARAAYREYYDRHPRFMDAQAPLGIAYFSLEFGLSECLPIYSGGLGVLGGERVLRALGLDSGVFHLNEGHSWLCAIERIRELRASRQMTLEEARLVARAGIVFTTHTPIAAGSDYFDAGLVWDQLGPYLAQVGISFDRFMDLGRQRPGDPRERLCTTYAALRLADQSVGVSRLHGAVSRRLG